MADAKALKRTRFTDVFDTIRDEVLEYVKAQNVPANALEWFRQVRVSLISSFSPVVSWTPECD